MEDGLEFRKSLKNAKRIVIKIGSRVLVQSSGRPALTRIQTLVQQMAELHNCGKEIVLVSSGAIAAGIEALGLALRPTYLPELQMAASVGQVQLMTVYNNFFVRENCNIGQVLLTHDDLTNRTRHLNARNTILALLRQGAIPIINENDVVSVDEIKFGDNDILASLVTILLEADVLLLLTSTDGLLENNDSPRATRVPYLESVTEEALALASAKGSKFSLGGMASKLQSAQTAVEGGASVLIADGRADNVIVRLMNGEDLGTYIGQKNLKVVHKIRRRKKWIAFFHKSTGTLVVDEGAVKALVEANNSLLPVGVLDVQGRFAKGSLVNVKSKDGTIIAKGLVDYSSEQILKIKGLRTSEVTRLLGSEDYEEVIHRENMVVISK